MKKTSLFLLAFVLSFSLAACGSDISNPSGGSGSQAPSVDKPEENEITFSEMTVVDNEQCSIKLLEIDPDNIWGYTVKAEFENKSEDTTYMFSVDTATVNGIMDDPFFASGVAPGKKGIEEISFPMDKLKENGVTEVTDIEVRFRVYDSEDWLANPVVMETAHIYPYGEEKAQNYVREERSTDMVVLDNDNVKVVVTGYDPDGEWGYTVHLFLLNKTDKNLNFTVYDASVNDYMASPFYSERVNPEKSAFSDMYWSDNELEKSGITDVETITIDLRVYDSDIWPEDDIVSETITLTPTH